MTEVMTETLRAEVVALREERVRLEREVGAARQAHARDLERWDTLEAAIGSALFLAEIEQLEPAAALERIKHALEQEGQ